MALLVAPPEARAQFGKNKVQYKDFDFRVLQTEHFDIHYYPEAEAAVLDAARMSERAYTRLSKVFRHEWEERKPLILYASQSDFQQTNIFHFQISEGTAGITEGLRNRIVLFFPSAYPEFEHTLTHELVHAFQFDILRRGALSQGSNPFAFRMPLWFAEGMAEYLSSGEIDPLTAMWLRDGSMSGYLTSIEQLNRVQDIRVYRFGQALWYYIGTKYGDEKVGEIMQKAPLIGVREAIQSSLNVSLDKLSEDWLEAVRQTYLPQIVAHPPAEDFAIRLSDHVKAGSAINVGPTLSPDGATMAFVSDRDFFNDIYIADAVDGEHADKLIKGERSETFESLRFLRVGMAFSPDGRYLAFSSKAGERDALYIMDVEDEDIVDAHRFDLDGIETPSWSPDGRRLVFTGQKAGTSDLYVVNRDGSGLDRLTNDRYAQRDPVWSPDGKRIAFTTEFGPGTDFDLLAYGDYQIGVLDLESREVTYAPDPKGKNINPQWGPDGRTLAFLSDRTGITNIFLYDFDTGLTYQLTDLLTGVSGIIEASPAFSWSRDGSRIVFSAFSDGGWDLYRLDDPLRLVKEPYVPGEEGEFDLVTRAFVRPSRPSSRPERRAAKAVSEAELAQAVEAARRPEADRPEGPEDEEGEVAAAEPRQPEAISYYLGERKRQAGARPETPGVRLPSFDEPVDVATLLNDPTVGLPRDTTRFSTREYKVSFQPDLITQPQVGFVTGVGAFGASQLAFSDLLGDHNLFAAASVYGSLTDSDLFFTYANLKKRMNWGITGFQFRSDFLPAAASLSDPFLFRSDIYRGVQAFGAYPFSRFRRIEIGSVLTHVNRREVRFDFFDPTPDVENDLPNDLFFSPSVAYVYDSAFYGSTGPVGGSRQRFEWQRAFGDRSFNQFYGDVRKYWLFGRRWTIASRLLYLGTFGQEPDNLRFQSIGGPTLLRGFDYDSRSLIGTTVGLLNLEFRFPLVEQPSLGSSGFPPIRGALWYDLGFASCGDDLCDHQRPFDRVTGQFTRQTFRFSTSEDGGPLGFRLVDARAAIGTGVRMNMFGFAVLRLDYAWQTDMAEIGNGRWVFTLAPEF